MKFNHRYYQFLFCHAPIGQVVKAMCLFLKKDTTHWGGLRSGKYSQKLIDNTCYNNANHRHPPKQRILFFTPSIAPDFVVSIITGHYTWDHWIGSIDPAIDLLRLRFTTDDKDADAIRELHLLRGNKKYQRVIRVMKDPKWVLFVDGEAQPFEEGKNFEKIKGKLIKNYFTLDDLIRFVNNWGCPFDTEEFWASNQPMYLFGTLDEDDNPADWKEENYEAWKN